jgi:hypothetical protein
MPWPTGNGRSHVDNPKPFSIGLDNKSRMTREGHDRFRESAGVRFPHATRLFLTIKGERHYLWRAVDQDGNVPDILVQRRRDKRAAKKFFRKLLKGLTYVPRVIITDKLKSYGAAKREILPGVEHRQHRYLNNRAEVRLVGQKPNTLGVWEIGPGALRSQLAGPQNLIPVSV